MALLTELLSTLPSSDKVAQLLNTATDGLGNHCLHVAAGYGSCTSVSYDFVFFLFGGWCGLRGREREKRGKGYYTKVLEDGWMGRGRKGEGVVGGRRGFKSNFQKGQRLIFFFFLGRADEVLDTLLDQEGLEVDPVDRLEADIPLHKAVRFVNGLAKEEWEAGAGLVELLLDAGADPRSVLLLLLLLYPFPTPSSFRDRCVREGRNQRFFSGADSFLFFLEQAGIEGKAERKFSS